MTLHDTLIEDHNTGGGLPSDGKINQDGLALIKSFEGYSSEPYRDPIGIWTIAYGSIRGLDGKRITSDHPAISEAAGEVLLRREVANSERSVRRLVGTDILNNNQFSACVSFVYNLGSGSFASSTLRKLILRHDLYGAEGQFKRWVFAGGRKLNGLVRRREAERRLFAA